MDSKMKKLLVALVATGLFAMGTVHAQPAKADNLSFINSLNGYGIVIYNASAAVVAGWTICSALNYTEAEQVARNVYNNTGSEVPDMPTARAWVLSAGNELCPWFGVHSTGRDNSAFRT